MEHRQGRRLVRRGRVRYHSLPSVNKGQRRSPVQRAYEYRSPGGSRMRHTPRKTVKPRPVYGPQPRPKTPPKSEVEDSRYPLGYESEEDPIMFNSSDGFSATKPVHVPYNLQLDEELADYMWVKMRNARRMYFNPQDYHLSYLESVNTLYSRKLPLDINLPDPIWIFTTMSFFPDTAFWNRKKISIVEQGPNDNFLDFFEHIYEYTRAYMYEEETHM